MHKAEIIRWLNTLETDEVHIDEGGLCLVCPEEEAYLEVGGEPRETEDDD